MCGQARGTPLAPFTTRPHTRSPQRNSEYSLSKSLSIDASIGFATCMSFNIIKHAPMTSNLFLSEFSSSGIAM